MTQPDSPEPGPPKPDAAESALPEPDPFEANVAKVIADHVDRNRRSRSINRESMKKALNQLLVPASMRAIHHLRLLLQGLIKANARDLCIQDPLQSVDQACSFLFNRFEKLFMVKHTNNPDTFDDFVHERVTFECKHMAERVRTELDDFYLDEYTSLINSFHEFLMPVHDDHSLNGAQHLYQEIMKEAFRCGKLGGRKRPAPAPARTTTGFQFTAADAARQVRSGGVPQWTNDETSLAWFVPCADESTTPGPEVTCHRLAGTPRPDRETPKVDVEKERPSAAAPGRPDTSIPVEINRLSKEQIRHLARLPITGATFERTHSLPTSSLQTTQLDAYALRQTVTAEQTAFDEEFVAAVNQVESSPPFQHDHASQESTQQVETPVPSVEQGQTSEKAAVDQGQTSEEEAVEQGQTSEEAADNEQESAEQEEPGSPLDLDRRSPPQQPGSPQSASSIEASLPSPEMAGAEAELSTPPPVSLHREPWYPLGKETVRRASAIDYMTPQRTMDRPARQSMPAGNAHRRLRFESSDEELAAAVRLYGPRGRYDSRARPVPSNAPTGPVEPLTSRRWCPDTGPARRVEPAGRTQPLRPVEQEEPAWPARPAKMAEEEEPSGPIQPAEPVEQEVPSEPTQPAEPAEEEEPSGPARPAKLAEEEPSGPARPAEPVEQEVSADPDRPAKLAEEEEPSGPVQPAETVEQEVPAGPSQPAEPVELARAAKEEEPSRPAQPAEPVEEEVPAGSTQPAEPVELARAAEEEEPSRLAQPAEPVEQEVPAGPSQPAEPVELVRPAKEEEPSRPAQPAEPVELARAAEEEEPSRLAHPAEPVEEEAVQKSRPSKPVQQERALGSVPRVLSEPPASAVGSGGEPAMTEADEGEPSDAVLASLHESMGRLDTISQECDRARLICVDFQGQYEAARRSLRIALSTTRDTTRQHLDLLEAQSASMRDNVDQFLDQSAAMKRLLHQNLLTLDSLFTD